MPHVRPHLKPSPTGAGFGYIATLTVLRSLFISADNKVIQDVRRNGTRTLSGSTVRTV